MKFTLAVAMASFGLAVAHGSGGMPHIVGGKRLAQGVRAQRVAMAEARVEKRAQEHHHPQRRDPAVAPDANTSGKCGERSGSCATGYCCSADGYCGKGSDYCAAPDCQLNYGSGCDGNQAPTGTDTSNVARPKVGSIPYGGAGVYDCKKAGDIAITFDDGPWNYTGDLLNKLAFYGVPATFMITGNNLGKGKINDKTKPWPGLIKRMIAEGHQIASHTWSHQNASQLSKEQLTNQMVWNEIAFNDILGFFPTYMRPPYSICGTTCEQILSNLGYHITYFDLDTQGYLQDSPSLIQNSKNIWDDAMDSSDSSTDSFLEIEHDIHYQTVYNLTEYIIKSLLNYGYRPVTLGECLGDPVQNWYRAGPGGKAPTTYTYPTPTSKAGQGSTDPPSSGLTRSPDGSCGGTTGYTCQDSQFGNCCSKNGYCGSTTDYCSTGCQSGFGTCSGSGTGTTTTASTTTTSKAPTATATTKVSPDGTCGGANGYSCIGFSLGNCCSKNGYCGSTTDYCGTGCQSAFGNCGSSNPSTSTSTTQPGGGVVTTTIFVTVSPTSKPPTTSSTTSKATSGKTTTTTIYVTQTTSPGGGRTTTTTTTRRTTTSKAPEPTGPLGTSTDGRCGPNVRKTCNNYDGAPCCGADNLCGVAACLATDCQPDYGYCVYGGGGISFTAR